MTDIEIIQKCNLGELDYFGQLYDRYIDKIYKYIYIKTSSKEVAEDITSEVFFNAINKINSFKIYEGCSFQAWLYKIASNKIIDFYTKTKPTEEIGDYLETAVFENFTQNIDNKNKIKEVLEFLKLLKQEQVEIFMLRIWDELSYKEISEITGQSIDNCKQIVSRTIKKINASLLVLLLLIII